ncbi:MAG: hypothetical protein ACTSSP_01230 [Candidatus Asgardarchaeia archaeon]
MTKINIIRYGNVDDETVNNFKNQIKSNYDRFKENPEFVEVLIIENSETAKIVKEREAKYLRLEKNVGISPISPDSAVLHHAWFDTPTIVINVEKYFEKDLTVSEGELIRAIVHSILHGKKEYYFIQEPPMYSQIRNLGLYLSKTADIIFYTITTGVKSWEVSKYLLEIDKERYSIHRSVYLHHLKVSPEEKRVWKKVGNIFDIALLLFFNSLKVLMEAAPFAYEHGDKDIESLIESNIAILPSCISNDLRHFLKEYLSILKVGETYSNIELVVPRAIWFIKTIKRSLSDFTL